MRSFRLLYKITNGAVSIGTAYSDDVKGLQYTLGNDTILICDHKVNVEGGSILESLIVQIDVNTDNFNDATHKGDNLIGFIKKIFTLQTNANVGITKLISGYETTKGNSTTEVYQRLYPDHPLFFRERSIYETDVRNLITNLDHLATNDPIAGDKVSRAFHYFSRGIRETDPIDRFTWFWVGLETVDSLLTQHYGITQKVWRPKDLTLPLSRGNRREENYPGVYTLFLRDSQYSENDYDKCRILRNDVIHSNDLLDIIVQRINRCQRIPHEMLRKAFFTLLHLQPTQGYENNDPIFNTNHGFHEFSVLLHISPDDLPDNPILEIKKVQITLVQNGSGRSITLRPDIKPNIQVPFTPLNIDLDPGEGGITWTIDDLDV